MFFTLHCAHFGWGVLTCELWYFVECHSSVTSCFVNMHHSYMDTYVIILCTLTASDPSANIESCICFLYRIQLHAIFTVILHVY
ncbi:hypothetical protein XENTR_v10005494 [Xenopus tropicalis]|nr:hypothetical protein XENTR_v10005494 [Xenopus tropicalis]